jgi:hypothetical protein
LSGLDPEKFKEMAHEAAFDAYMTGVCFASLSKYIEIRPLLVKTEEQPKTKKGKNATPTPKANATPKAGK